MIDKEKVAGVVTDAVMRLTETLYIGKQPEDITMAVATAAIKEVLRQLDAMEWHPFYPVGTDEYDDAPYIETEAKAMLKKIAEGLE